MVGAGLQCVPDARSLPRMRTTKLAAMTLTLGGDVSLKNIVAQRHADVGHVVAVMANRRLKMHASGAVTAGPPGVVTLGAAPTGVLCMQKAQPWCVCITLH